MPTHTNMLNIFVSSNLYFIFRTAISYQLSLNTLCIVNLYYYGLDQLHILRLELQFYCSNMRQNLQICTDHSMQRFLQWSSVCSPTVPVVIRGESQDPDNSETLVIINAYITIYELLQGKMRGEGLQCNVKKMEDWFDSRTNYEVAMVVTLSALKTIIIVCFVIS